MPVVGSTHQIIQLMESHMKRLGPFLDENVEDILGYYISFSPKLLNNEKLFNC